MVKSDLWFAGCGMNVGRVIVNVRECPRWETGGPVSRPPLRFPRGPREGQSRALGPMPGGWDPPTLKQAEPVGKGPLKGAVLCD